MGRMRVRERPASYSPQAKYHLLLWRRFYWTTHSVTYWDAFVLPRPRWVWDRDSPACKGEKFTLRPFKTQFADTAWRVRHLNGQNCGLYKAPKHLADRAWDYPRPPGASLSHGLREATLSLQLCWEPLTSRKSQGPIRYLPWNLLKTDKRR